MPKNIVIIDNMPAFTEAARTINGVDVQLNLADGTCKRQLKPERRAHIAPVRSNTFVTPAITLRLESFQTAGEPIKRLPVHSDGKVKTALSVLAKAHQTYAFERPYQVISDKHLFNKLTQRLIKEAGWQYTQRTLPIKRLLKCHTLAPEVNAAVMERIDALFTAILLFKGIGYAEVKKDLELAEANKEKGVTYNVNTTVTFDEKQFKVSKIRVKKVTKDGIFYCSKSCKPIKSVMMAILQISNADINNLE